MSPERGGLGVEALRGIARALVDTGELDYVSQSEGARTGHYARSIGSYRHGLGEFLPLAHGLRDAIGGRVPVIAASRINESRHRRAGARDRRLRHRRDDASPDRRPRPRPQDPLRRRIRHCVGANQGCVDRMVGGLPITCFHNPDVGREERGEPEPAAEPRSVLVVGGGPAGLKAAEIAARRGHRVTLLRARGRARWPAALGPGARRRGRAVPVDRVARARAGRPRRRRPHRCRGRRGGPRRRRRGRARDRLTPGSRADRRGRRLDPGAVDRRGRREGRLRRPGVDGRPARRHRERALRRARRRARRRGDDRDAVHELRPVPRLHARERRPAAALRARLLRSSRAPCSGARPPARP